MKLIKLFSLGVMLSSSVHAATVTVSAGFGTNGLLVTSGGVAVASQFLALGNWNSGVFTQFGSSITADTGAVSGAFTATAPTSLNGLVVHLYVGTGNTLDFSSGANYIVIRATSNTAFPADVSSVLATATVTMSNWTTASVVTNSTYMLPVGTKTIGIPEPSSALLGAIGALALLRRRRI